MNKLYSMANFDWDSETGILAKIVTMRFHKSMIVYSILNNSIFNFSITGALAETNYTCLFDRQVKCKQNYKTVNKTHLIGPSDPAFSFNVSRVHKLLIYTTGFLYI